MKKAVILNFPTHGCINPLLATVTELVKRGEQVIYFCTEEFRNKIERTGAEFRAYQGGINDFRTKDYDLFKLLKFNIEMTLDKLENNLGAIRKETPDYIIHDSLCTWGKQIASILALPAVNLMHSFPIAGSADLIKFDNAPMLIKAGLYKIMEVIRKDSSKGLLKKKYQIDLSIGDSFINREGLNIVYTSKHMNPAIEQTEKDFYFVGPSRFFKNEPGDFPFDQLKDRKVVYISLGTMHNDNPRFYKTILDAFSNKKCQVVMAVGFEIDLQDLSGAPGNFIIRKSVPQQRLLEKVDLFITHAGMNSVNESICAGVPMLLLPHQFEQKLIAHSVRKLGMGRVLNIDRITPAKLYENAKELLADPKYKEKSLKFRSIFLEDEKTAHIKAADKILNYVNDSYKQGP